MAEFAGLRRFQGGRGKEYGFESSGVWTPPAKGGRRLASLVTLEPWNPGFKLRSNITRNAPFLALPIRFLSIPCYHLEKTPCLQGHTTTHYIQMSPSYGKSGLKLKPLKKCACLAKRYYVRAFGRILPPLPLGSSEMVLKAAFW